MRMILTLSGKSQNNVKIIVEKLITEEKEKFYLKKFLLAPWTEKYLPHCPRLVD
jgi:hypothetical protein